MPGSSAPDGNPLVDTTGGVPLEDVGGSAPAPGVAALSDRSSTATTTTQAASSAPTATISAGARQDRRGCSRACGCDTRFTFPRTVPLTVLGQRADQVTVAFGERSR